ncbi:MAG: response regulator [Pseudomonadota bacterium]
MLLAIVVGIGLVTGIMGLILAAAGLLAAVVLLALSRDRDLPWLRMQQVVVLSVAILAGYFATQLPLLWASLMLGGVQLIMALSVTHAPTFLLTLICHIACMATLGSDASASGQWALPGLVLITGVALTLFLLRWQIAVRYNAAVACDQRFADQLQVAREKMRVLRAARAQEAPTGAFETSADGLAHSLNNILTPVYAYAELLEESDLSAAQLDMLAQIKAGTEYATRVGGEMRRKPPAGSVGKTAVDLLEEVRHLTDLANATLSEPFQVVYEMTVVSAPVELQRAEFQQAFLTLLLYVRQSLGGGKLVILARECEMSDADLAGLAPCQQRGVGRYLALDVVVDPQQTVEPETHEAFFRLLAGDDDDGQAGTILRRFARTHDAGFALAQGRSGLRVCLPLTERRGTRDRRAGIDVLRNCHILVIDDNPAVRGVSKTVLEKAGYHVSDTDRGEKALELFETTSRAYAAVLLDVRMPGMGGIATLASLRAKDPQLPVLLFSGYEQSAVLDQLRDEMNDDSHVAFLAKPFRASELVSAMDELMLLRRSSNPVRGEGSTQAQ